METRHERLVAARAEAGYPDAATAARAMGIPTPTYQGHENGSRGLARSAERYARFFRVNLDWLLTGRGEMRLSREIAQAIPVMGRIREHGAVEMVSPPKKGQLPSISLPGDGSLSALEVCGDSMRPRFLPGEYVLFDREPAPPSALADQYAVVQTADGRVLIKILRNGRKAGLWRLDAHNADPEEDVELQAAWRYLGVLPPKR